MNALHKTGGLPPGGPSTPSALGSAALARPAPWSRLSGGQYRHVARITLVAVAQFMVVLDISITNVALPSIKTALDFGSDSALQWVITAYALTFGGFLLLGGRMADLFGRRRTLLVGMSCFSLFSLAIGFSQSALILVLLRGFQGCAAALMSPSALSIVLATF